LDLSQNKQIFNHPAIRGASVGIGNPQSIPSHSIDSCAGVNIAARGRGPYPSRTARQVARSTVTRQAQWSHAPGRKPLPAHLPREEIGHPPGSNCSCCGDTVLRKIGTHRTEVLEYVPSSFKDDASYYTPCYGAWLKKRN
jgi:hypothetical protein